MREPTTAFVQLPQADSRLVQKICQDYGKFDAHVYLEEFSGDPASLPRLLRTAEQMVRIGQLRVCNGAWYRAADVLSEGEQSSDPLDSDIVARLDSAGALITCSGWDGDEAAVQVGTEERDREWSAECVSNALDELRACGGVTRENARVLLDTWMRNYQDSLGERCFELVRVVQAIGPVWTLTPTMFVRREMANFSGSSSEGVPTRLDRYRRYSVGLCAYVREGRVIPEGVQGAILREFIRSRAAVCCPGPGAAEAEIAIERRVGRSLLDILFACGVTSAQVRRAVGSAGSELYRGALAECGYIEQAAI